MKKLFLLTIAVTAAVFLSSWISTGGKSWAPVSPAYAQLDAGQITGVVGQIQGLSNAAQNAIGSTFSPAQFGDLAGLTAPQFANLNAIIGDASIPNTTGLPTNLIQTVVGAPTGIVNEILSLPTSAFSTLASASPINLTNLGNISDLASSLGVTPLNIANEFSSVLGGTGLQNLLASANPFSNLSIPGLSSIAGNLGVDFGSFASGLAGAVNLPIDQIINLDITSLISAGIPDLGSLISTLGLSPTTVLSSLVSGLGVNPANLLNLGLNQLSGLGINGLGGLSNLLGINPSNILNGITGSLGISPSSILGGLTNLPSLNLAGIIDLDFGALSSLGIGNLGDLASILGGSPSALFGNLASLTGLSLPDVLNFDLGTLSSALNISSIADFAGLTGLSTDIFSSVLSSNLGLDLLNFADIGLDSLLNLGFGNALDLLSGFGIPLGTLDNIFSGLGILDLANLSIPGLSTLLGGVGSLGGIIGALGGGSIAAAIGNLGTAIGAPLTSGLASALGGSVSSITGTSVLSAGGGGGGPGTNCCSCIWFFTNQEHKDYTQPHFNEEMKEFERWLIADFLNGYLLPGMMGMTEEFTVVALHQVSVIGGFIDGWMEVETHRTLQELQTIAHRDYHTSEGVCVFATNVRALAKTDRFVDENHLILNTRSMMRHLGRENDNAAEGKKTDLGEDFVGPGAAGDQRYRSGRLKQFQDKYCDPEENLGYMKHLCGNSGAGGTSEIERLNRDIDYANAFAMQDTLNIDFIETLKDPSNTAEELPDHYKKTLEDLVALQKNLYGHEIAYRPEKQSFKIPADYFNDPQKHDRTIGRFLDYRSYIAKKNVVENSFNAIAAMKTKGASGNEESIKDYMSILLTELGMPSDAIDEMLKDEPSYYAQMDILTRKIYQNPQFFINLYEQPANVKRKKVALQAIGLMQDWDIYESKLRIEMLSSILLELALIEKQKDIDGDPN